MSELANCAFCNSFAIQSLTVSGKHEVHCFNEFSDGQGGDCGETGPACETSQEAIDGWNAQQAAHRAGMGERDEH